MTETLIVWTEPNGVDYALSFQDPDGCEEVWNFIQEVQRHMATAGASHCILVDSLLMIRDRGGTIFLSLDWPRAFRHYGFNHSVWPSSASRTWYHWRDREGYQSDCEDATAEGAGL